MMSDWEKIQKLYETIAERTRTFLNSEWERRETSTREDIALQEQVIQDCLRDVFQPLVQEETISAYSLVVRMEGEETLRALIKQIAVASRRDQLPFFTLVGAHYRSQISVRGRRSSIIANKRNHFAKLREFLPRELVDNLRETTEQLLFTLDLWQAVFLDQYFHLFGKTTTMNEWILEKLREKLSNRFNGKLYNKRIGVLVDYAATKPTCTIPSASEPCWVCIGVPKVLSDILLNNQARTTFYETVTESVLHVISTKAALALEALKPPDDGQPSEDAMYAWFELLRDANARSTALLDASGLREVCASRRSYVAGRILFEPEYEPFRQSLLECFAPAISRKENARHDSERNKQDMLRDVVKVLQAMLLYTGLYGDSYLTFPFFPLAGAGCSLTFMLQRDERVDDGLARMAEHAQPLSELGFHVFDNVMTHAAHVNSELDQASYSGDEAKAKGAVHWPTRDGVEAIRKCLMNGWPQTKNAEEWLRFILTLSMNLASAKHEGKELGFSFLLGNPHNLIHDLSIEHEFLLRKDSLTLGPAEEQVAISLSLIKGNYAFLQDPEVALFVSYPGFPLEITHIVRLPSIGVQQGSRKRLLRAFTEGKNNLLGTASYGNGRADLFYQGKLHASYSEKEWKPSSSYEEFWKRLVNQVGHLVPNEDIHPRLRLVVERVSDEPGHGAVIVLGSGLLFEELKKKSIQLTRVFDSVEKRNVHEIAEDLLFHVAIEDGGTFINAQTGEIMGRCIVPPVDPRKEEVPNPPGKDIPLMLAWKTRESPYHWERWHKTLKWGTRHLGALGASLKLRDEGLVIVISADGPVHVLRNGKVVTRANDKDDSQEELVYGE